MFKTHYYVGIKKYQWTCIPLSMRGIVVKNDGELIMLNVGEKDDDPIFTITDLLPHLAIDQSRKSLDNAIDGESLNILVGNIPFSDDESSKKRILNILKNNITYQISELGKVDLGGGGTVAFILANKGIEVLDCGIPILSMHSPYEVASKFDIYMAYQTYKAFYNN